MRPRLELFRLSRGRHFLLGHGPMITYVAAFSIALVLYELGWSGLYPRLGSPLLLFLVATGMICMAVTLLGWLMAGRAPAVGASWWTGRRVLRTTVVVCAVLMLECLHAGGVPILLLASGSEYDYREFGIPTFHVVLFGVYNFLAIHWYRLWLQYPDPRLLWCCVALVSLNLMIVNRGALIQCAIAIGFLYIVHRRLTWRAIVTIPLLVAGAIYLFGLIGDSRMRAMGMDPESTIVAIGDATDAYPAEQLGSGPFWFYLYASSPLANLQLNIDEARSRDDVDFETFAALELLPDFVSKRLLPPQDIERDPLLITPAMTVSTAYGRAFYLCGWPGAIAVFTLFILYFALSRWIFRGTEYFDTAMAIMTAGAALLVFFNMLIFAGFVGPMLIGVCLRVAQDRARRHRPAFRRPAPAARR